MDHLEKIQAARKALTWRLELLSEVAPIILNVAESEGKKGVAQYLHGRFGVEPIEEGTDLLFKEWRFKFDERGDFIGMSSGSDLQARAIRKSDNHNHGKNDT